MALTVSECYLMALQKAEENATNGGIKLDRARFIQLFNAAQVRLVRSILDLRSTNDIQYIQKLLVYSEPLAKKEDYAVDEGTAFSLPSDFLFFSNVTGTFSDGECSASDFEMEQVKNEDVHKLLADVYNRPDFGYRYTFYTVGESSVRVYTDGFTVDALYLTYYRFPKDVDISGYIHADGTASSDIDPELDDNLVYHILDMVQKQFALNEGDITRYSADSDNVNNRR